MTPVGQRALSHEHGSTDTHEPPPRPSDAGSVVLDIGPGAGVAIVVTPPSLCGEELEIRRAGTTWDGRHVAVRQRNGVGTTQYAAIFGPLPGGDYEFRVRGDRSAGPVVALRVDEAGVTLARWPAAGPGAG